MNTLRYKNARAALHYFRVISSLVALALFGEFPVNAQSGYAPASHGGYADTQASDIQKQMAALDSQISQWRSQLPACARDRQAQMKGFDQNIANLQSVIQADQQAIGRYQSSNPSMIPGYRQHIIDTQNEISSLQQQRLKVSSDFSCEHTLNAQISQALNTKNSLQSKLMQMSFARSGAAPSTAPTPPASSTPNDAPWGFGGAPRRDSTILPPQPPPATFVDQNGNYASGPPLNSGFANNTDPGSYGRAGQGSGDMQRGYGGSDQDPSIVSYDSAGQPIDADGLVVEYSSEAEREYDTAQMREGARRWEESYRASMDGEGRKYDQDRAEAEAAGASFYDPFDPHPDNAAADAVKWENVMKHYHDDPNVAAWDEEDSRNQRIQSILDDPNNSTVQAARNRGGEAAAQEAAKDQELVEETCDAFSDWKKKNDQYEAEKNAETLQTIDELARQIKARGYVPTPPGDFDQ
jgi:hypothetical protein